jgi:hypothetical protein
MDGSRKRLSNVMTQMQYMLVGKEQARNCTEYYPKLVPRNTVKVKRAILEMNAYKVIYNSYILPQ